MPTTRETHNTLSGLIDIIGYVVSKRERLLTHGTVYYCATRKRHDQRLYGCDKGGYNEY
jgi:hypothetical protein